MNGSQPNQRDLNLGANPQQRRIQQPPSAADEEQKGDSQRMNGAWRMFGSDLINMNNNPLPPHHQENQVQPPNGVSLASMTVQHYSNMNRGLFGVNNLSVPHNSIANQQAASGGFVGGAASLNQPSSQQAQAQGDNEGGDLANQHVVSKVSHPSSSMQNSGHFGEQKVSNESKQLQASEKQQESQQSNLSQSEIAHAQYNESDLSSSGREAFHREISKITSNMQQQINVQLQNNRPQQHSLLDYIIDDDEIDSDVPDEHTDCFSFNEHMRQYDLKLNTITWKKDSLGLFDFETRQVVKSTITLDREALLVRTGVTVRLMDLNQADLAKNFENENVQVLGVIRKERNSFVLEPSELLYMQTLGEAEKKVFMRTNLDRCYSEEGTLTLKPREIHEKIYIIVRNMRKRNKPVDYALKKGDIIKLGRAKFKVKAMMVRAADRDLNKKRNIMRQREEQWRMKQYERAINDDEREIVEDFCTVKQWETYFSQHKPMIQRHKKMVTSCQEVSKRDLKFKISRESSQGDKKNSKKSESSEEEKDFSEAQKEDDLQKKYEKKSKYPKKSDSLQDISQRRANNGVIFQQQDDLINLEEKPAYFNLFEELEVPSEDDMVVGEDNYIEIKGIEEKEIVDSKSEEKASKISQNDSQEDAQEKANDEDKGIVPENEENLKEIEQPKDEEIKANCDDQKVEPRIQQKISVCSFGDSSILKAFENKKQESLAPNSNHSIEPLSQQSQGDNISLDKDQDQLEQQDKVIESSPNKQQQAAQPGKVVLQDDLGEFVCNQKVDIGPNQNGDSQIQQEANPNSKSPEEVKEGEIDEIESVRESLSDKIELNPQIKAKNDQDLANKNADSAKNDENLSEKKDIPSISIPTQKVVSESVQQEQDLPQAAAAAAAANDESSSPAKKVDEEQQSSPKFISREPYSSQVAKKAKVVGLTNGNDEEKKDDEEETPGFDYDDIKGDEQPVVRRHSSGDQSDAPMCRFCWDGSNSDENPLLSVCKCIGGVGLVHYSCLKFWLEQKKQQQETPNSLTLIWSSFGCEICHQIYPYIFKVKGRKYTLVDIQRPTTDYIILESLTLEQSTMRIIQIFKPPRDRNFTFKIGRTYDQDLHINDISVSRKHAMIKYDQKSFVLKDNLSKFGTLAMVKKQLRIRPGESQSVQIGRSVIHLNLQYRPVKEPKDNYKIFGHEQKISKGESIDEQKQKMRAKFDKMVKSIRKSENSMHQQQVDYEGKFLPNGQLKNIFQPKINRRQLNIDERNYVDFNSDEEEKRQQEEDFLKTQQLIRSMQLKGIVFDSKSPRKLPQENTLQMNQIAKSQINTAGVSDQQEKSPCQAREEKKEEKRLISQSVPGRERKSRSSGLDNDLMTIQNSGVVQEVDQQGDEEEVKQQHTIAQPQFSSLARSQAQERQIGQSQASQRQILSPQIQKSEEKQASPNRLDRAVSNKDKEREVSDELSQNLLYSYEVKLPFGPNFRRAFIEDRQSQKDSKIEIEDYNQSQDQQAQALTQNLNRDVNNNSANKFVPGNKAKAKKRIFLDIYGRVENLAQTDNQRKSQLIKQENSEERKEDYREEESKSSSQQD